MGLTAGTILGQYEIRSPLGAGGMGEVYRAHDIRLDRDVAIKVLPEYLTSDPERLRRFEQEARATAALNHPNILAVHQMATQNGVSYLVEELLDGETMRERLRRGPIPLRKAIDYAVQIAHGLAAAHDKGIVHRDLKPENLFLTKDGRVKILDFGLAKIHAKPASSADGRTVTIGEQTDPGTVLGTVGYMSPEQVRGENADNRSDIFALGTVLYEMVTGRTAFRKPTKADTISAILTEDPPSILQITPTAPPGMQRVVHRCLEKSPEQRFQSASDLAFALDTLSNPSISSEQPGGAATTSRPFKRWAARIIPLGILVLAVGVGYLSHRLQNRAETSQVWEQMTDFPDAVVAPTLSPDGRMLAFIRGADSFLSSGNLYVKLLPKGEPVQLTHQDKLKADPSFSPDGSQVAYSTDPPWDTWVVPVLGGQPRLMLPNASGLTWIDNQHILFSEIRSGVHMAVVTATESRAEQRDVYVPPHDGGMAHRSYLSPDHKWVLIAGEMDAPYSGFYCRVVPFDGSSLGNAVGPTNAFCSYAGWSPDGKWMFFSANVGSGFHLWRQAFPDGEPEQLTFGPTEQEGVAVAPDGGSLFTSVGLKVRTVWVHDHSSDHQIAFNGSATLMGGQDSSRAVFSTDGSQLFFLGARNSGEKKELWRADLRSGQVERILSGFNPANSFDISPDGNQLVVDSYDANGTRHLWRAWLDRHAPPEMFHSKLAEGSPVFGPDGDIYYEGQIDGKVYLYRRSLSGGEIVRVTPHPIVRLETISPDGKWLIAEAAIEAETKRGVQAFNVGDGSIKRICSVLCLVRWATQGRFMYVAFPGNTMSTSNYKTFIIPLRHGSIFPDLPLSGIQSEHDLDALNGVKIVNDLLHPGSDNVEYGFDRASDHRNIYRIPIR